MFCRTCCDVAASRCSSNPDCNAWRHVGHVKVDVNALQVMTMVVVVCCDASVTSSSWRHVAVASVRGADVACLLGAHARLTETRCSLAQQRRAETWTSHMTKPALPSWRHHSSTSTRTQHCYLSLTSPHRKCCWHIRVTSCASRDLDVTSLRRESESLSGVASSSFCWIEVWAPNLKPQSL